MTKGVSLLTWLMGKYLALKGFAITGVAFELVSKVSGRGQYLTWKGRGVYYNGCAF